MQRYAYLAILASQTCSHLDIMQVLIAKKLHQAGINSRKVLYSIKVTGIILLNQLIFDRL